jgi:putative aldouronate transport system substrate-binding protein
MAQLTRRTLLKTVGVGALTAAGGPVLTACSGDGGSSNVGNVGADLVPFPTWVRFDGPKPDLPGDDTGVQPLYRTFPRQLVRSVDGKPGDGSEVTAMVITYTAPPTPLAQNRYWQAINEALGVNLNVTVVPSGEYAQKMATVMAGGDLPDILFFGGGASFAREHEFIASKCADLSEHVGGDAVKEYPALANIPPYAWKSVGRIGGRLYGIPLERPMPGNSLLVNRTAFDRVGAPRKWTTEQYLDATRALTTAGRQWGIGGCKEHFSRTTAAIYHAGSHGAPNQWKVESGAFVSTYETPQFQAAIETMRTLNEAGAYHPDSTSVSLTDLKTYLYNEQVASMLDGYAAFSAGALKSIGKRFTLDFALPYGEQATPWQGTGRIGYIVLKKAPAERIKVLLRVCNYLAAPFGTVENTLVKYGIEGAHYTRDAAGDLVQTKLASTEVANLPLHYVAAAPLVIYFPGRADAAQRVYDWEKELLPRTIPDPSNGLRSETLTEKSAQLDRIIGDGLTAIVLGRRPASTWADVVADWKAAGGARAADELAKEHAASNR